jgi:3-phenylpropionate/trans-cinnamate dioxygenase ferredoxin reductase subunit
VARLLGLEVTLVDPQPAPMIRQLGPTVANLVADLHTRNGVRLRTGAAVIDFSAREGRVSGVGLDDGSQLPADLVLVAIGSTPATSWRLLGIPR